MNLSIRKFAVIILAGTLSACGAAGPTTTSPSDTSPTPSAPLTPARSIAGTWSTDAPVTFIYQTDFCGQKQDVARALWNVTWTVTAVSGFSNVVDVEMRFTRGTASPVGSCQPSGWVPLVSPTNFRLCLSSSSISRCNGENYPNGAATGSFTTDLMMLSWSHYDCIIYCSGEVTEANALKMTKKS